MKSFMPCSRALLNHNLQAGTSALQDKNVVVIGGGDTGTDCIGTSVRHGAKNIINLELMGQPPAERAANNRWPYWPRIFRCILLFSSLFVLSSSPADVVFVSVQYFFFFALFFLFFLFLLFIAAA